MSLAEVFIRERIQADQDCGFILLASQAAISCDIPFASALDILIEIVDTI